MPRSLSRRLIWYVAKLAEASSSAARRARAWTSRCPLAPYHQAKPAFRTPQRTTTPIAAPTAGRRGERRPSASANAANIASAGTATGTEGTTVSEGPYRFIGPDTLTIGAEQEPALRYHRERTTSGNQTGTERSDVWFSARTGLPLRNERHLEAHTETVIGAVGYTEDGSFELVSLDPVR